MDTAITTQELESALKVLRLAAQDVSRFDDHLEFKTLVAKINRQARQRNGREVRQQLQSEDAQTRAIALEYRALGMLSAETPLVLHRSRNCYVCKMPYNELQPSYHLLCPNCVQANLHKRHQRSNLTGRVALITGGRIKIGFELTLKLLRDGARVIVTSRFPEDAASRFAKQADFSDWAERLEIHGLDLRHLGAVQAFIDGIIQHEPHLDILINNAAQTISRPLEFYAHLLDKELIPSLPALVKSPSQFFAGTPELPGAINYFPAGLFDADGQAIDARPINSWLQKLHEIPIRDVLEVQVVNFIAPFMFCAHLKPLLERSPFERRFVVNVSAMEGQFSRMSKSVYHPHTNAAKAALNMLTRTSGADYARSNIFMTAVDTGWITDENPLPKATRMRADGFAPPLDSIDGAARIYDPIAAGINQSSTPYFAVFLKNYQPYPW
jgi:NAD(P)-dependent dehydrogenase (short-subunit alcohol dehydrogenase family)